MFDHLASVRKVEKKIEMSEDLNLPESLERLEINPERHEGKSDEKVQPKGDDPECSLELLSLNAVCPKESCQCNKRKESRDRDKAVKRLGQKRPILRRSKLSPAVLRAPILKLPAAHIEPVKHAVIPNVAGPLKDTKALRTRFQTEQNTPSCSSGTPTYRNAEYYNRIDTLPPALRAQGITQESLNRLQGEVQRSNSQSCCAVQARIAAESPQTQSPTIADDTNIDELASYFDLFVHIPKKMSQMAEMMYI
ncbi:uncharacterized protein LOC106663236 [Cimex lectularius]|uniref:Oxidative stress-responsive serine-rich protein 1 n=1 Tax=Cimex lectularius TaxID=79782 RepID=A0A8I6RJT8_CIMLE|nr:uncharacterized protein LOC106663236 [Cimex lectularius]